MKLVTIFCAVLLVGCTTPVPITYKFPPAPDTERCTPLKQHDTTKRKPSEVAETIANNYADSKICAAKVDMWLDWYQKQAELFSKF